MAAKWEANLYRKIGETFGKEIRDEVCDGFGIASIEMPGRKSPLHAHNLGEAGRQGGKRGVQGTAGE